MNIPSKVLTGFVAAAAAASVGLPSVANAAAARPQTAVRASLKLTPPSVPAGPATIVAMKNPCSGATPVSITGFPAPNGATTNLQVVLSPTGSVITGVWPPPGPASYTITVSCPSGTKVTGTETVESAPQPTDIVGVGSDTFQNMFDQGDWLCILHSHACCPPKGPCTYPWDPWDATNPVTGAIGDSIVTKQGCPAIPRPDGSSAGITALTNDNPSTSGQPCIDFARSSSPRGPTTPNTVTFVTMAGDAVDYAVQPGTHAPADLTTADLTGIYNCTITQWNQIPGNSGGSSDTIDAFLPQSGSGTRSFFLAQLGVTTPGTCVSSSATQAGAAGNTANTLEENEGIAPSLNGASGTGANIKDVIYPFAVSAYLAERFHSASCGTVTQCYPAPACQPKGTQNLFGCDIRGTMNLGELNSTDPTTPFPPTNKSIISTGFSSSFLHFVYNVVCSPDASGNGDDCTNAGAPLGIPTNLQPIFSSTSWGCTASSALTTLKDYGFLPLPAGTAPGDCGSLS